MNKKKRPKEVLASFGLSSEVEKMMYTIRNLPKKTKKQIGEYATEHGTTVADALSQLVEFGLLYYEQNRPAGKKYADILMAVNEL